jgi:hypothetical protein
MLTEQQPQAPRTVYAWCFSHGRMHTFDNINDAWCTADWIPLAGTNEFDALADKIARYGNAEHHGHLSLEAQERLSGEVHEREKRQANRLNGDTA